jgi:hypothetical protein
VTACGYATNDVDSAIGVDSTPAVDGDVTLFEAGGSTTARAMIGVVVELNAIG